MNDLRELVYMLEYRFKHIAQGTEKFHILNLLKIYYPILQTEMTRTIEIRESKAQLKELESVCLHLDTTKEPNMTYVYKCDDCGKTIYM
jgi:hypothetical protein